MFGWLRLALIAFVLMTVVYVCLSWYSKSIRREQLQRQFDAGGIDGDRDAFIEAAGQAGLIALETNTQPGMTPTSLVPEQAAEVGFSFPELCDWIVKDASCDR